VPALDGAALKLAEHAAPVPLAHLLLCADFFPAVAKFREDGGERHKLCLVRQVTIEEDVLQREELRRPKGSRSGRDRATADSRHAEAPALHLFCN
jgi:hypothetical protein